MCYHTKSGRSTSTGVGMNRTEPQKLGSAWVLPLGMRGVAEPQKYAILHMLPSQICSEGQTI